MTDTDVSASDEFSDEEALVAAPEPAPSLPPLAMVAAAAAVATAWS